MSDVVELDGDSPIPQDRIRNWAPGTIVWYGAHRFIRYSTNGMRVDPRQPDKDIPERDVEWSWFPSARRPAPGQ